MKKLSFGEGSAFYLLRRKETIPKEGEAIEPLYLEKSDISCYEKTIGPIPLCELTKKIPSSLVQIPPLLWNNVDWTESKCRTKHPLWGDFIVCVEGMVCDGNQSPVITGGFFTSRVDTGIYGNLYKFITWSSTNGNKYGFVYCSHRHIHTSVIDHVLKKIKYKNECT